MHTMITPILICMLECTHVHLARFCYDRLNSINFVNNNVWVRKGANPHGPNRVWVPKFAPILFDVGVGSRLM